MNLGKHMFSMYHIIRASISVKDSSHITINILVSRLTLL